MPVCTYIPHGRTPPTGAARTPEFVRHDSALGHRGCHSEFTTANTSGLPPPPPATAHTTHVGLTLECDQGCVGWRRCRPRRSSDDTRAVRTRMVTHRDSQRSLCQRSRQRWRHQWSAPSLPCWRHRTPRRMQWRRWKGRLRGATRCVAAQTRSRRRKAPSPKRFAPSAARVRAAARVNTHLATRPASWAPSCGHRRPLNKSQHVVHAPRARAAKTC